MSLAEEFVGDNGARRGCGGAEEGAGGRRRGGRRRAGEWRGSKAAKAAAAAAKTAEAEADEEGSGVAEGGRSGGEITVGTVVAPGGATWQVKRRGGGRCCRG